MISHSVLLAHTNTHPHTPHIQTHTTHIQTQVQNYHKGIMDAEQGSFPDKIPSLSIFELLEV